MTRTTRNISLGLLGSAVLTACFLSCSGCGPAPDRKVVGYDKDGKPIYSSTATTRSRYRRSSGWFFGRPGFFGGGSSYAPAPTPGSPGGGKSSSGLGGGSTGRGGFGGIGSGGS